MNSSDGSRERFDDAALDRCDGLVFGDQRWEEFAELGFGFGVGGDFGGVEAVRAAVRGRAAFAFGGFRALGFGAVGSSGEDECS